MKNILVLISLTFILLFVSCYQHAARRFKPLTCPSFIGSDDYSHEEMALGGDSYTDREENPFIEVTKTPTSTFSIDADGASYANVRRFIMQDKIKPPKGAIRTEELINYFELDYPSDNSAHPITLNGEVSGCPWNKDNKIVRIGIKGKVYPDAELLPSNFVFLVDVSGSMDGDDRLELLKKGYKSLVDNLHAGDRVAIVTYAGTEKLILESTSGIERQKIKDAIDSLGSGGGTAGAKGIVTAYEIAEANFNPNGNNRVILGTDGDFNIGISNTDELVKLIKGKRDKGIFLSVLGVGRGNLNDGMMEQLADNGNGTYEYIDHVEQLKKVFVYERQKFYAVAKDVKVQITFNTELVESYRLIGYENRMLKTEDFKNDSADAGEIGSGQNITALYEIVPRQNANFSSKPAFKVHFRYKFPRSDKSDELELEIFDEGKTFEQSSDFMKFASGIASFSMLLSNSKYKGNSSYEGVLTWLNQITMKDEHGFRQEFREVVVKAKGL